MLSRFYPDPLFGWSFYAVLVGFLVVATYIDLKSLRIPKQLTMPMLALGILVEIVRGIWMGAKLEGTAETVFWFASSPGLGALDGFLCALMGFLVGFAIGFGMWILGLQGGGDVKLTAALGAWVGPLQLLLLVLGATVVYVVLGVYLMIRKAMRRGVQKAVFGVKPGAQGNNVKKTKAGVQRKSQLLAYSLPVAVATILLVPLLVYHNTQRLPQPHKTTSNEQTSVQR